MAQSKDNVITHGMSGKFANIIVFSQRNGKTIAGKVPKPSNKPASTAQKAVRKRFQEAIIYGKRAIQDPLLKEAYAAAAKPGETAYNVAVADLYHAPDIEEIDLSAYTGSIGDIIKVKVVDDFMVASVHISIANQDGSLVEEGEAVLSDNGLDWIYTATVKNDDLSGDRITIQAHDKADNLTELTETHP